MYKDQLENLFVDIGAQRVKLTSLGSKSALAVNPLKVSASLVNQE